jgi:hypothetical protein
VTGDQFVAAMGKPILMNVFSNRLHVGVDSSKSKRFILVLVPVSRKLVPENIIQSVALSMPI